MASQTGELQRYIVKYLDTLAVLGIFFFHIWVFCLVNDRDLCFVFLIKKLDIAHFEDLLNVKSGFVICIWRYYGLRNEPNILFCSLY